jgi:N-acetylglucosamine kinase-like BadF-type ATPase
MSEKPLLLAVDGGGTKTQAIITDVEGRVLARGLGPGSNLHSVGFEQFSKSLTTAVDVALRNVPGAVMRSGEPAWRGARIEAACFGLSGVDGPEDEAEVTRWVKEQQIAPTFSVLNDSELILAAGTPEGWGIALISGTGSVCLGRARDGRTVRCGGWGFLMGDEGSGYAIAQRALHLATQAADGRADAQELLNAILRVWSLKEAGALIRHVHGPSLAASDVAALAVTVQELAAKGDRAALSIVEEAGSDLAVHVDTVSRLLGLQHPPLALAGSGLRGRLRESVRSAIRTELGPVQYVEDPSMGAVVLARRLINARPS